MNKKITYDCLLNIYENDIMENYKSKESKIEICDWNDSSAGITSFDFAIYAILHNPERKENLSSKKLRSIRTQVMKIKEKIFEQQLKQLNYNWYTESNEKTLEQRLGKYSKYFIRKFKDKELKYDEISDTKKKYLNQSECYILNSANGIKDEIQIVFDFLKHIEEEKESYKKSYEDIRKYNKNTKKPKLKPLDIDNSLKSILAERLKMIDVSDSKIKRITASTIKAIKKEILKIV